MDNSPEFTDGYSESPDDAPAFEPEAMSEEDLYSIAERELQFTESRNNTLAQGDRIRAMNYYYGDMQDTPAQDGRSKAMLRTVRDTIGWILPSIMRVFFASDEIAAVVPKGPEDEQLAQQQQDGLNYIFTRDCKGEVTLYSAFHDALLLRNGVVKFWWEKERKREYEDFEGLDEWALNALMADESVEIERVEPMQVPPGQVMPGAQDGMAPPMTLYSGRFYREVEAGKPMLMAVPPEEFRIDTDARNSDDARFMAHVTLQFRGDLIAQGYDPDKVSGLKAAQIFDDMGLRAERERYNFQQANVAIHTGSMSTDRVVLAECYMRVDTDGDGIPEWHQVCLGGGGGSGWEGLSCKKWTDPVPFVDFVAEIVPHRREGLSIFDQVADMQQIGTVILRSALDNVYAQGNAQKVVNENQVLNMDEVVAPQFNGVIRVNGEPSSVVMPLQQAFIADGLFQSLEVLNNIVEMRTGVSRATQALDPKALSNVTATGTNAAQSAAYSKIEQIARNFANRIEVLLKGMNALLVTHQDKPHTIRMRGKWAQIDPRQWNKGADIIISPAVAFGSKEKELMMLQMVLGLQKEIVASYGAANPVVPPSKVLNTAGQMVRAAGLRNSDLYFNDVPDEQLLPMIQQKEAGQTNPIIEKAKIQAQADAEKAKLQAQTDTGKAQLNAQTATETTKVKAMTDIQIADAKADAMMQIRREEMAQEAELRAIQIITDQSNDANIRRPQ